MSNENAKREFKIGDRVVIYSGPRLIGEVVTQPFADGLVEVRVIERFGSYGYRVVHPKQLRHLTKKEPKYYWTLAHKEIEYGPWLYLSEHIAKLDSDKYNAKLIKLKEVKDK